MFYIKMLQIIIFYRLRHWIVQQWFKILNVYSSFICEKNIKYEYAFFFLDQKEHFT